MVKREKFLEDAKGDPARFYRTPNDVLRDRRLSDEDRREILSAWAARMQESDGDEALIELVRRALAEVEGAPGRRRAGNP